MFYQDLGSSDSPGLLNATIHRTLNVYTSKPIQSKNSHTNLKCRTVKHYSICHFPRKVSLIFDIQIQMQICLCMDANAIYVCTREENNGSNEELWKNKVCIFYHLDHFACQI